MADAVRDRCARSRPARRCSTRRPIRRSRTTGRRPPRRSRRPAGPSRAAMGGARQAQGRLPARAAQARPGGQPAPGVPWPPTVARCLDRARARGDPRRAAAGATSSPAAASRGLRGGRRGRDARAWTRTCTRCSPRARPCTGGSNVIGFQDPALDKLLEAAGLPGRPRRARPRRRPSRQQLASGRYLLPLAFADEVVRGPRHGSRGRRRGQVADPADRFWDVLTWRLAADR